MSSPSHHTNILTKSEKSSKLHPNHILPTALQSNNLHCQDETPKSAQHLVSQGKLNALDFIETSPEIEGTLIEAFIEDDYEGKLHLITMRMTNEEIVGISFWREIPSDEMGDWMDMKRIAKAIEDRNLTSSSVDHDEELSHNTNKRMQLVKSESVSWIENALKSTNDTKDTSSKHTVATASSLESLTHSWVKIELIAIKQSYRAHHLGNMLLGFTLAKAHALHHNDHAILHVAGGGASKNTPAAKLYRRYGFVSVPQHEKGGPFVKPDRDLFVLGNIGRVLNTTLPWDAMQLT
jgi:ribosomal protein S18 acetylase RimI-like enzyme